MALAQSQVVDYVGKGRLIARRIWFTDEVIGPIHSFEILVISSVTFHGNCPRNVNIINLCSHAYQFNASKNASYRSAHALEIDAMDAKKYMKHCCLLIQISS